MHNTTECHHYKKDGTPTCETISHQGKISGNDQNSKKSYVQVVAHMEKLEKSLKKVDKKIRSVAVMRKVTVATPIILEVLGTLVLGK